MRNLSGLVFTLALAGCSSTTSWVPQEGLQPTLPSDSPDQIVDYTAAAPAPQKVVPKKPSTGRTATALKNETNERLGGLMDCDASCKNNCSPKNQSRPKWCVLYQVPSE
jgi:hypothetical protein